jgi:hypothetical protein
MSEINLLSMNADTIATVSPLEFHERSRQDSRERDHSSACLQLAIVVRPVLSVWDAASHWRQSFHTFQSTELLPFSPEAWCLVQPHSPSLKSSRNVSSIDRGASFVQLSLYAYEIAMAFA